MKPTVLIVDDDENTLYGLVRALNKQPYQLLTAKSGDEAMWILKTREVDVIVADEVMPGMSGGELLAWAAENVPDTIRIMLTGNATTSIAIRAINEGRVYHFFTKPCDDVQLAITIRKAIEHRELVTENHRLLAMNRQQFDELQEFSKKLRLLARVVAKDLRTPLEKVTHSCSTLTNQYGEYFEPKAKALLENAAEAVSEVQHIVKEMIERARFNVLTELSSQPPAAPLAVEPTSQEAPTSEWES
jgi:two-component system probable response regulator PhcQ